MKTTKKLMILGMAAILSATSLIPTTFSWYNHDESKNASSVTYMKDGILISDKATIQATTFYKGPSVDPEKQYLEEITDDEKTVAKGKSQYYKTKIKNTDKKAAIVNMYLDGITQDDKVIVGSSAPVWNYSDTLSGDLDTTVLPDVHAGGDTVKVYFQPKNLTGSSYWNTSKVYLVKMNTDPSKYSSVEMTKLDTQYGIDGGKYDTYVAEIPADVENIFFTKEKDPEDASQSARTKAVKVRENIQNAVANNNHTIVYYPDDTPATDSSNHNYYKIKFAEISNYAHIKSYVGSASMNKGDYKIIAPEYTGTSISYSSNNQSVATVNSDGKVHGVSNGTATITATVTGTYGSEDVITTRVIVSDFATSVVQNLTIPAGETVEVLWYIKNNRNYNGNAEFEGIIISL